MALDEADMTLMQAVEITHGFGAGEGQRRVLSDISLKIEAGESVALIGPNGVGKTTLMRILAGLLKPTSGRVELRGGEDLHAMSRREVARQLTVVPQARPQVFDFSALDLVLMGFHARTARFSLPSAAHQEQALAAMAELDVADLADRPASVLSGGELQRVLMARTMTSEAPLWLLDEPTSNLDIRHQIALLEQVTAHCARGGAALGVLHDLALAHRYFERVIILDDGKIRADGPSNSTLDDALLSQVFQVDLHSVDVGERRVWVVK